MGCSGKHVELFCPNDAPSESWSSAPAIVHTLPPQPSKSLPTCYYAGIVIVTAAEPDDSFSIEHTLTPVPPIQVPLRHNPESLRSTHIAPPQHHRQLPSSSSCPVTIWNTRRRNTSSDGRRRPNEWRRIRRRNAADTTQGCGWREEEEEEGEEVDGCIGLYVMLRMILDIAMSIWRVR